MKDDCHKKSRKKAPDLGIHPKSEASLIVLKSDNTLSVNAILKLHRNFMTFIPDKKGLCQRIHLDLLFYQMFLVLHANEVCVKSWASH